MRIPDEFDLNYYTYGLRLYGNMPLIEPVESRGGQKNPGVCHCGRYELFDQRRAHHNFLKETYTILTEQNSFFAKSRIRIIQCDDQVRMDEEVKKQPRTRTAFKSFYRYRRRRNRFQTGFCLCERIIRAGRVEKSWRAVIFYRWQGHLSEETAGI